MSISKDVERIGDYGKNILEVFEAKPQLGKEEPYYGRLITIKTQISELFKEVLTAYHESDKQKARAQVTVSFEHQQICDKNINEKVWLSPQRGHR